METKREPTTINKQSKNKVRKLGKTSLRGQKPGARPGEPQAQLNSQESSAGKLNFKKTRLQRRQNLHESDKLWPPSGPVRMYWAQGPPGLPRQAGQPPGLRVPRFVVLSWLPGKTRIFDIIFIFSKQIYRFLLRIHIFD